ncbi:hypothetical protein AV530_000336 [Patagioenas fasciata monilis]|uniref:Uncharacterized protein n=1 Tax=Patagioenas fasciata monilis TaxID=372326 RepID=A0A1V4KDS4_PATFA|nr:hypothetical protein AV530_000336 [Patagioenas fasciata monilis]
MCQRINKSRPYSAYTKRARIFLIPTFTRLLVLQESSWGDTADCSVTGVKHRCQAEDKKCLHPGWAFIFRLHAAVLQPLLSRLHQEPGQLLEDAQEAAGAQRLVISSLRYFGLDEESLTRMLQATLGRCMRSFVQQLFDTIVRQCSGEVRRQLGPEDTRAAGERASSPDPAPVPSLCVASLQPHHCSCFQPRRVRTPAGGPRGGCAQALRLQPGQPMGGTAEPREEGRLHLGPLPAPQESNPPSVMMGGCYKGC